MEYDYFYFSLWMCCCRSLIVGQKADGYKFYSLKSVQKLEKIYENCEIFGLFLVYKSLMLLCFINMCCLVMCRWFFIAGTLVPAVLMATSHSYGNGQTLTTHRIRTP